MAPRLGTAAGGAKKRAEERERRCRLGSRVRSRVRSRVPRRGKLRGAVLATCPCRVREPQFSRVRCGREEDARRHLWKAPSPPPSDSRVAGRGLSSAGSAPHPGPDPGPRSLTPGPRSRGARAAAGHGASEPVSGARGGREGAQAVDACNPPQTIASRENLLCASACVPRRPSSPWPCGL